jgi:beta-lactam-binding protein with PASTA domain
MSDRPENKRIVDLQSKLKSTENELLEARTKISALGTEKELLLAERELRSANIKELIKKNEELKNKLEKLQVERPKLSPESLMSSFGDALNSMQEGLHVKQEKSRVDYVVSNLEVNLRTNVTSDKDKLYFQLPFPADIIPPENLSIIHFTVKAVPRVTIPPEGTAEAPDLIGMKLEDAKGTIEEKGFSIGEVVEKISVTTPGRVIGQHPAGYSLVPLGDPIDLVISKIKEIRVPRLVGIDKNDALKVISSTRGKLKLGKVTERVNESTAGTVVSQSLPAGTLVPVGSTIDLVTACAPKVPVLTEKTKEKAIEKLKEEHLDVGKITEKASGASEGIVIGQNPKPGTEVKIGSTVDLILSTQNIKVIEGIGPKTESKLRDRGITTFVSLSKAPLSLVSDVVGEKKARNLIAMAKLMVGKSNLYGIVDEEAAEMIVLATDINTKKKLADADPTELYKRCRDYVATGKVKVPEGYKFTVKDVQRWINTAKKR